MHKLGGLISLLVFFSLPVNAEVGVLARDSSGHVVTAVDLESEADRQPRETVKRTFSDPENVRQIARNIMLRRILADQMSREIPAVGSRSQVAVQLARERVLAEHRIQQFDGEPPSQQALEKLAFAEYNANRIKYRIEEAVNIRHIQIGRYRVGGRELAEQLLHQLRNGKGDFGTLALQYSDDAGSKIKNGDMGFFEKGRLRPELDRAAFALVKRGELSDVIETDLGWHLLRLEEHRASGYIPFDSVKDEIANAIAKRVLDQRRSTALAPLEQGVDVDMEQVSAFSLRYR